MKAVVTGARGFVGRHLVRQLTDLGTEVASLDLDDARPVDITDADAVARRIAEESPDVVYHLAARSHVGASWQAGDALDAVNVGGTRAVVDACAAAGVGRVLVVGSAEQYGAVDDPSVPIVEDTECRPLSPYGRTKVEAEQHLLDSANVITLRLATVFGMSPRMRLDLLVNHFVYTALTEGYIVIFEKDFKRNYIHVRDVADCMLFGIANAARLAGRPYNLGLDSANLSKEELALKVKQYVPNFYVHFAAIGQDPDKRNYVVSSQRLREAGFEARRSLDEGIQELLKGYRMMGRGLFKNAA